jgi:hypothetical protein
MTVTPEEGLKVTYLGITETNPNKSRIISKSCDDDKAAEKEQHPLEQKGGVGFLPLIFFGIHCKHTSFSSSQKNKTHP